MTLKIPGYVLFNEVSKNDQYVTYQGIRESDQKPIYIKISTKEHPTLDEISNLKHEYEITKDTHSPLIIKPILLNKFQNLLYLVYADEGFETLDKFTKSHELSLEDKLKIAINLTEAVHSYQNENLIHKNLEPRNIFVKPTTFEVKISGFSYATKQTRQKLSVKSPAQIERQVAYISPEQTGRMNRELDYRTDFYSLGVILYEFFSDKKPFDVTDVVELIHSHIAIQPPTPREINPRVPRIVSDIIMKLMSKTVEERYASLLSLEYDLKRCLKELETSGKIEPFSIAQNDVSPIFQISQKLYGREQELIKLNDIMLTIAHDPPQLCLLSGFSGIGKTSLVAEMQKPIYEKGGFFIAGKFDQFKTNIPYSGFIQALQDLIQHILTESEDRILYWKERILESLGQNSGVITDVIPELKLIIGDPPKPQELDTEQTYNRFSIVFQLFIKTFASPITPLVIFLDDMQWVDSASLKLIEMLLTSHQMRGFLIVGAYRSNEMDRYHPFMVMVERLRNSFSKITELEVNPLTLSQVTELIADSLHKSTLDVKDLAKIINDKTQGNPFFINQLLTFLYEEKMIQFNSEKGEWIWNLEQIISAKVTDNIVTLLVNKLQKCSEITQKILKLAACTGHSFDATLINHIADYPPHVVLKHIDEAIHEGFIVPDDHMPDVMWDPTQELEAFQLQKGKVKSLKFAHDRVQQAAYSLIPSKERKFLHYRVGKILLESPLDNDREDKIFDIVYQINHAFELVKDPEEKITYAKLNLTAGERAMNAVAYITAIDYLRSGLNFLPNDRWKNHYDLSFQLQIKLAECSFLIGEYDEARELFDHTLKHVKTDNERIAIYILRIKLFTSTTQYFEAIQNGRMALKLMGVDIPQVTTKWEILKELVQIKWKLLGKDKKELHEGPKIESEQSAIILNVLFLIIAPAYLSTKELYAYLVLKGLRYCMQWGYSPSTPYFFAAYGIILNILTGDIKSATYFGDVALKLPERFNDKSSVPAVKFLVGAFVMPLTTPYRYCIEVLKSGFEMGITVGDFIYGVYALAQLMASQYVSGKNLHDLYRDLQEYKDFVSKVKAHNRGFMFVGAHQAILALKGKTHHPSLMASDTFDEEEFFKNMIAGNYPLSLYFVYVFKLQITYLFDKYEEAVDIGKKADEISFAVRGHPINIEKDFYSALALSQIASEKSSDRLHDYIKKLTKILKRLKKFAKSGPSNFLHKYLLVKAEIARLKGLKDDAVELYDKAIESARENDYIQNEAIANELFAKFWISLNKIHLAKQYLIEAHYNYYCWGADAKVKDLEDKYPQILSRRNNMMISQDDKSDKALDMPTRAIDIDAVFKASEMLSGQIELNTLIEELLKLAVENAGAERAVLILEENSKWIIKAERNYNDTKVDLGMSLEKAQTFLPQSLIMYVLRTKEPLIVRDAEKEGLFTSDTYVQLQHIKSMMALPLIHQSKIIGVLYLENNLTTSAFTSDRVEVLKLLSSQIANSVENALLYAQQANLSRDLQKTNLQLEDYSQNLEKNVYLRTHELKAKNEELQDTLTQIKEMQKKLIQQEKLVSLGSVAKTIASEMRNPLNYIFNFSELSQELINDVEISKESPKETLDMIASNLKKINEHAKKADEIITSLLEESRGKEDQKELTDINKLIRDYADLVYYNYYKIDPMFSLTIDTHYDSNLPKIIVSQQNIGRVIYNIIDNACYATDIKKKEKKDPNYSPILSISTALVDNEIQVKIKDNGIGIAKEFLTRIFTPFTTNKPSGKGAGMGLSISYDIIVQEHQGTIKIDSEQGVYTEVTFTIPIPP
jgi:predicted ATPase/signal transduction histidine kinase